jgi:hypothetical protein
MKGNYLTPTTRVIALHYDLNLLYSGLKDMQNQLIFEEELDDDTI